ncbi:D-alanyl-D-alanine carboxypeptidase family protein [Furfurilactobacillus siliginis]|uniref:Cytochrome c553 n=1 Tax=Furfurilactobacillus siliginis TaxID=348151 RepID=A0A0R2L5L8_9LACO|nr:serine hydrolase [Furfurilactobacillus siliginis]KRN96866.1 D-alanyl-D-alanine carboxypeptidase [Furfurilactobacillus siliginis]GEK28535.1 cytochrome c553 [Furfurilactobacillus siliginis]
MKRPYLLGILVAFVISTNVQIVHASTAIQPEVSGKAAIVIDAKTGQVLAAKNDRQRLPIASTSKLLITYLVEQKIAKHQLKEQQLVKIDPKVARLSLSPGLTNVPLTSHRRYTVHELLEDALLPSGNAAAVALGNVVSGNVAGANRSMERLLTQWGISNTRMYSPAGLTNGLMGELKDKTVADEKENELSARELAIVAQHLMNDYPQVREITRQAHAETTGPTGTKYPLNNTNKLIRNPGSPYVFTGIKTGSSPSVGGNFIGETTLSGQRVITVILGSGSFNDEHTRFAETVSMLAAIKQQLRVESVATALKPVRVIGARTKEGKVNVALNASPKVFMPRSDKTKTLGVTPKYIDSVDDAINSHQTLGTATIKPTGTEYIGKAPAVKVHATHHIDRANLIVRSWRTTFHGNDYQIK